MPLSWDFTAHWFALFGSADWRLTEQGRNRGRYSIKFHGQDDLFAERVV
jgi:hypothetical protein